MNKGIRVLLLFALFGLIFVCARCPSCDDTIVVVDTPEPTRTPAPTPLPVVDLKEICPELYKIIQAMAPAGWTVKPSYHGWGILMYDPNHLGSIGLYLGNSGQYETGLLTDMQEKLASSTDKIDLTTEDTTATVYGETWDAYTWWANDPITATLQYAGLDTVVPYGQHPLYVSGMTTADQWAVFEPVLGAVLGSIEKPAADFVHTPPEDEGGEPGAGWSSYMTTRPGLSVDFPGDWLDPESPWEGEGVWLRGPDEKTGVAIVVWEGTDPAQALTDWEATALAGGTIFSGVTVEAGDPVTLLGVESPALAFEGQDEAGGAVTGGVVCAPRGDGAMQVVWYAPAGEPAETAAETFTRILASIRAWEDYYDQALGLSAMYPFDWSEPTPPPDGQGVWMRDAAETMGMIVTVHEEGDEAQMLADWETAMLAGEGIFTEATVEDADPRYTMGESRPVKRCQGVDASGADVTCGVTFASFEGGVVEILWYAPTGDDWNTAQGTLGQMRSWVWVD